VAKRWQAPWLQDIALAGRANRLVAASSGVKKNFGFVHHGPHIDAAGVWHVPIPGRDSSELRGESHLYRPDVDAYLFQQALLCGCRGFPGVDIKHIDFREDHVELRSDVGTFRTRFVIDASGVGSVLSRQLGLREEEPSVRTRSRALFTHMVGVTPFDDVYEGPRFSSRFHEGTLHHFFEDGWVWVIPFDNHPRSQNRLCSVGLTFDLERRPLDLGLTPAQEWNSVLARYPKLAEQFQGAQPVRPWIRTGRVQYSTERATGPRYWITAHAHGAVDALYSRGLLNGFQGLHVALPLIHDALGSDTFDGGRMSIVDDLSKNALEVQDLLTYGTYSALGHVALLGCWLGVWNLFEELSIQRVLPGLLAYARSGDLGDLSDAGAVRSHPIASYESAIIFLRYAAGLMENFRAGAASESVTMEQLLAAGSKAGVDLRSRQDGMQVPTYSRAAELGIEHYLDQ
jgi:FADH2 O2-dependent halogenase